MKVTVAFDEMKIVVPCGSGEFSVRDLAAKAVFRAKNLLNMTSDLDRLLIHHLSLARDGGILDWDDHVSEVLDDREQLIAEYSVTSKLSDIGVMNHFKGPLTPLVFDLDRLHESPTSFAGSNPTGIVKGPNENGRAGLLRYPTGPAPGAGATCCSSSSSLSLSSGSCGAIFANSAASVNNTLLLNVNTAGGLNLSSSSAISGGSSSAARHPDVSPCMLSQLKEAEVPPTGLFEESNKADSGYKSDHVRIFDLPPPSGEIEATDVRSGQRSSVTPPLPPPVDFDSLTKKSGEDFFSDTTTPTTTASSTVERQSDHLNLPFPASHRPIDDKLFEVLSRRRAMLRTNWDYEANEYDEGEEEEEEEAAVEEGEEDDFMEIADAVTLSKLGDVGSATAAATTPALMTEARQQPEASTAIARLGTGNMAENEAAEEEDEDTSDEGLLTVRRVLPQAQPLRTAPQLLSTASAEVGLSRPSVDGIGGEAGKPVLGQNCRNVLTASSSLGAAGQETDEMEISTSTDQLVRAAKLQGSRFSPARMLQSQNATNLEDLFGLNGKWKSSPVPQADATSAAPDQRSFAYTPADQMERQLKGGIRLGNPLASNGFGVPTIVEEENEEEGGGTSNKQERLRSESSSTPPAPPPPHLTSGVPSAAAAAVLAPVPPPVTTRLNSGKRIPPPPPAPLPPQPAPSTTLPGLKPASAGGLLPNEEEAAADMGDTTEEDYPLLRLDYRLTGDQQQSGLSELGHRLQPQPQLPSSPRPHPPRSSAPDVHSFPPPLSLPFDHRGEEGCETNTAPNQTHRSRGLTAPEVAQWLKSTEAARAAAAEDSFSPFGPCGSTPQESVVSSADAENEEEVISVSQHDLVSRVLRRNVREASEPIRRGLANAVSKLPPGYSNPIEIHLTNPVPGENLGIQIKPIFSDPNEIIPFVGPVHAQKSTDGKWEAGLEVHAIMPNGRIARDGTLCVGDRILRINGISLIGIPFDKGREIFQAALKQTKMVLQVLPYVDGCSFINLADDPASVTKPRVLRPNQDSGGGGGADISKVDPGEKPSCGLVLIADHSAKAKEAEAQQQQQHPHNQMQSSNATSCCDATSEKSSSVKPPPPPPPRRSPNTVLSQLPASVLRPLIAEALQSAESRSAAKGTRQQPPPPPPVSPPSLPPRQRNTEEELRAGCLHSGLVAKTIRLKKGSSGLGFSLTSREHHQRKNNYPVFIKKILPGGSALLDGKLKPGDQLLMVDDKDVSSLGQAQTVALLREKPVGSVVSLVVASPACPDPMDASQSQSHSSNSEPLSPKASSASSAPRHGVCPPKPDGEASAPLISTLNFGVDPSRVRVQSIDISLPSASSSSAPVNADGRSVPPSTTEVRPLQASCSSSLDPVSGFTLGVSVRVRQLTTEDASSEILQACTKAIEALVARRKNAAAASLTTSPCSSTSQPPLPTSAEFCRNAVFVRTVIAGGAAHRDGRLRVGDRLLAIDNEPLSCLSSPDALKLLKTCIARITANREPYVRLLIARRLSEESRPSEQSSNASRTPAGASVSTPRRSASSSRMAPTPNRLTQPSGLEDHNPNLRTSKYPNEVMRGSAAFGSLDSLLLDTANRVNSFVVSADVHNVVPEPIGISSELIRRRQNTAQPHESPKPSTSTPNQPNLPTCSRHAPDSDKQTEKESKFNVIRKYASFEGLHSLATSQCVDTSSSRPTVTKPNDICSEDIAPGIKNVPRPSYDGPNVSTSTNKSPILDATSAGRGRSAGESTRHLSDSSGYEAFPWDTESHSSARSLSDPDTASEPELPSSRATKPPARSRITPRLRPAHYRGRRRRRRRSRSRTHQLLMQQPMVDFKNMVMVPFDSCQWGQLGEEQATVNEHQPQESVAVQTSPLEDVSGGATSSEAYNSETGRRQSAIKLKDVVAPIFRKNYKGDTVQMSANAHEERHDSEKKKVQHPSEGVLKKLLRFVKPCARSAVEYTPPATRIVSGRTRECGPVVFSAARSAAIPIVSASQMRSAFDPDNSPSLSPSNTVPSQTSSISSPAAPRRPFGRLPHSSADSRSPSGTPSSRKTKTRVRIIGKRPQPLVHRRWQDSGISGPAKPLDNSVPLPSKLVKPLPIEPPEPSQLPFTQETLGRRPESPASTSQTDKCIALPTAPTLSRPSPSSRKKGRHNYAELSFNNLKAVESRTPASATGTCDSSSLLAHIPPPMPLLNPLNFTKLRSVLSCESEGRETAPSGTQILHNNFTINQLYDMDLSSCSTAYESIVDLASKTGDTADTTKPKPDSLLTSRKVYEDAEALYRYLSHIKTRAEATENAPTSTDPEKDDEKSKDCVAPKPFSAPSPSKD